MPLQKECEKRKIGKKQFVGVERGVVMMNVCCQVSKISNAWHGHTIRCANRAAAEDSRNLN